MCVQSGIGIANPIPFFNNLLISTIGKVVVSCFSPGWKQIPFLGEGLSGKPMIPK
jgi:hypothetical protein